MTLGDGQQFSRFDLDSTGDISIRELYHAVRDFLHQAPIANSEVVSMFPDEPPRGTVGSNDKSSSRHHPVTLHPHGIGMDADSYAMDLMKAADRMSRNGQVSMTELQVCLNGTEYMPFIRFMTESIADDGFNSRFAKYDVNKSGDVGILELTAAVREYLGQPPTQADRELMAGELKQAKRKSKKKEPPSLLSLIKSQEPIPKGIYPNPNPNPNSNPNLRSRFLRGFLEIQRFWPGISLKQPIISILTVKLVRMKSRLFCKEQISKHLETGSRPGRRRISQYVSPNMTQGGIQP